MVTGVQTVLFRSVLQNGGNFVNDNREPQGGSGNLYWQQLSAAQ